MLPTAPAPRRTGSGNVRTELTRTPAPVVPSEVPRKGTDIQALLHSSMTKNPSFINASPGGLFDMDLEVARASAGQASDALASGAGGGLDRSLSDLQQMINQSNLDGVIAEIAEILKSSSEFEHRLSAMLRRIRTGGRQSNNGAASWASMTDLGSAAASNMAHMEPEEIATELLALGYMVQIRDGTQPAKDSRSCLRTLKHRFLVCVGWHDEPSGAPNYLEEPLVVEPRFRDQFVIANSNSAYDNLLLRLPYSYVGPLARLEQIVEHLARELAAAFKQMQRPLPPWRTKQAMMSKWAPAQVQELARLMKRQREMLAAGSSDGVDSAPGNLVTGPVALSQLHVTPFDAAAAAASGQGRPVSNPDIALVLMPLTALPPHTKHHSTTGVAPAVAAAAGPAQVAAAVGFNSDLQVALVGVAASRSQSTPLAPHLGPAAMVGGDGGGARPLSQVPSYLVLPAAGQPAAATAPVPLHEVLASSKQQQQQQAPVSSDSNISSSDANATDSGNTNNTNTNTSGSCTPSRLQPQQQQQQGQQQGQDLGADRVSGGRAAANAAAAATVRAASEALASEADLEAWLYKPASTAVAAAVSSDGSQAAAGHVSAARVSNTSADGHAAGPQKQQQQHPAAPSPFAAFANTVSAPQVFVGSSPPAGAAAAADNAAVMAAAAGGAPKLTIAAAAAVGATGPVSAPLTTTEGGAGGNAPVALHPVLLSALGLFGNNNCHSSELAAITGAAAAGGPGGVFAAAAAPGGITSAPEQTAELPPGAADELRERLRSMSISEAQASAQLLITRRSSSDLSRAASKLKTAKGLLAAAFGRSPAAANTSSSDGTAPAAPAATRNAISTPVVPVAAAAGAAAAPAAAALGGAPAAATGAPAAVGDQAQSQQQQQQAQRSQMKTMADEWGRFTTVRWGAGLKTSGATNAATAGMAV